MSLNVFTASQDACADHFTTCDELGCQLCRDIAERWAVESEWIVEYVTDLTLRRQEGR